MTVSYSHSIYTTSPFAFLSIIFRWKGSAWKRAYREYFFWVAAYCLLFVVARFDPFHEIYKKQVIRLLKRLDTHLVNLPLTLLLGFFVSSVIGRFNLCFKHIGNVVDAAQTLAAYAPGTAPDTVTARRNVIRYLCLAQVLLLRDISTKVRRRFPNLDSLVQAGYMQEHELEIFLPQLKNIEKFSIPLEWASILVQKMRKDGLVVSDTFYAAILNEITKYYHNLHQVFALDCIPVPLAYPQVVFCVVRSYLLFCIVGRQYVDAMPGTTIVAHVSTVLMTFFQIFVYLSWIKVAEGMLNPLGDDDDDIECNTIIDKNIATGLQIVDPYHAHYPEQRKDNLSYVPLYSEYCSKDTNGIYVGSAVTLDDDENEKKKVKMVERQFYDIPGQTAPKSETNRNIGQLHL